MTMRMKIYGIYNTISGGIYTGITNNEKRRWREHKKVANSTSPSVKKYAIHYAIAKYGVDNFIFKVLEEVDTIEEAKAREVEWISTLRENNFYIYNETDGGDYNAWTDGMPQELIDKIWTPERRKTQSEANMGEKNYFYGKQLSGEANGNYGKGMKPHVKEKLLQIRRKLTQEQVDEMRKLYEQEKYRIKDLSEKYKISISTTFRIVNYQSWVGLNWHRIPKTKPNLKKEDVLEMRSLYDTGNYTYKELAIKYNLSHKYVSAVIARRKWKNI